MGYLREANVKESRKEANGEGKSESGQEWTGIQERPMKERILERPLGDGKFDEDVCVGGGWGI